MTLPNNEAPTQVLGASGTKSLPRVNLLPPEIQEAAKFRRFQLAMAAAGVAAVAVVGMLTYSAHQTVGHAKAQLASAESDKAALQGQLASLQSVGEVYTQVAAKKAMLTQAMSPEIRWSYYLTDLSLKIPQNVWLTSMAATEQPPGGAPTSTAASAASVVPAGIGTITFAGTAFTHDDVATWLDRAARERGFSNVYFTNSTKTAVGPRTLVNFSSSVTLTPAALSGRYNAVEG